MTTKEKMLDIAMLLGTAIALITALFAGFARDCDSLRDSTFRLHILANSDSEEDQRIKYALRDYMLTELGGVFGSCESKEETEARVRRNLPYIEQRANDFLRENGCSDTVHCEVGSADFPTRMYGSLTLPAGRYDALRVVIGSGAGQNWWCVLYPSVCLRAASAEVSPLPRRTLYESRKSADRATADSLLAQRGGIEFRFALYDLLAGRL